MPGQTSVGFDLELRGFKDLERKLKRLEKKVARRAMSKGLRAGAKIIHTEMKARTPVQTGLLSRSHKVRAAKSRRGSGEVAIQVVSGHMFKGEAYYGGMIEFGTSRMAAQPFIRPAFDTKTPQALSTIRARLASEITREATST